MKILIVWLLAVFLIGCAIPKYPSLCDNPPEDSWICTKACELGVEVEDMDLLISTGTARMKKAVAKPALEFYTTIEWFISRDVRWNELIDYVRFELNWYSELSMSRHLPHLYSNDHISRFDKSLIYTHINHQRALLR